MARISTYISDVDINPEDKWIGSDANNGFQTKNFTAKGIAYYLNRFSEVGSDINYRFIIDLTNGVLNGTMAVGDGWVNNIPISTLTQIKLSKNTAAGRTVLDYLQYIAGEEIIIFNTADKNSFGHFRFVSLQESTPDVYIATVEHIASNGVLVDDEVYAIGVFTKNNGDKHYRHIQSVSSDTWSIEHSLDKYPAVVVKDSAGSIVVGDIDYVDENNVTLTFSGAFSGEAYLN